MDNMQNQTSVKEKIIKNSQSIAVVGLSTKKYKAGYYVPAYLKDQGYKIIPVNPNLTEPVFGETPYANLSSIPGPVDLVLIFQRSENVPQFIDQAITVGAKAVWLQLGIRHDAAAQKALDAGLDIVMDACMMVDHRRLG